ncbi:MAG: Glycosyltransferase [Parcubacteria group bacterium GW2011_GWC1_42_11]|uniref:Glycosyltransferase n=1 Tax=Candidatus Nomurabacteria bacterium GW2011_GWC2_42_20 TaxID=1618756 RepID=A0A0G0ZGS6_9BACT|nr:MAG: Glycosyltransferase [Parcubacteria group bacterium GW2011_GWC1_42_11]KKS47917.1 MAG: Glycosyltransferase [Candidatus Nomurabacteria bacterium GW2011_GWC2_42_20]KKS59099.1 MAG: Glycosyltransferase [Candidatus Nomurabacteria bacterium GW2011_GWA2_42_41]KKT09684.1 MAG: Glycosyltransferase [Candidatus Nomurabacteria bacterium GW2011_GWB1_43_20]TAN36622.1 MAG: glycosyltransferase [Patescibacteria group bacterium]HBH71694.1 hypothetical protein [Candidatus Yonathbacteria bacterium]
MKILSIGSDRKVFEKGSAVRSRLLDYGRLAEELHVIVFAKKSLKLQDEISRASIDTARRDSAESNIFLYSTNSLGKFFHIPHAILCALKLKRSGVLVDVVTTQDPFEAGLAGYVIARILKARLHIQIHTDVMSPSFAHESILNRARVLFAKFLIPHANAIRVVSKRIKNSIEKIARVGTPISVLPILVEIKNLQHTIDLKNKYPQFDKIILVASRLSSEKNIEGAIDAVEAVVKKYPKTGLIIVGSGSEEVKLKKRVTQLGLEKNVIFEGWKDDLSDYYKTADVFVLPSYYEGYGMVVVEALSFGCPVVMTDVGCAGDMVKDRQNGLIVPVGDTEALAHALDHVVSGKLKFDVKPPKLPTKEEYLTEYKKSWMTAL